MYKFKIINYKPYEYELLQAELDELGKEGYQTDDISFFTFFKKTNKKYYYKIDFYIPKGKKRQEKKANKQKFFDPYLAEKYMPVYTKNGMYVFAGSHPNKIKMNLKDKKEFVNQKKIFKYLYLALTSLIVSVIFLFAAYQSITIDTFNTYGLTFVFIGLILVFSAMTYRALSNMSAMAQLKEKIFQKDNQLTPHTLKRKRKIYLGLFLGAIICLTGGLIEDTFNPVSFSTTDHPILLLKDLGIENKSELQTQARSSFTVPHSYTALETMDDETSLFIKEYNLSSESAAKRLINDFEKSPKQYYCTSVERKDNILYGQLDETLTTLIVQKEKKVTLISPSFELTSQQINTIINFYN